MRGMHLPAHYEVIDAELAGVLMALRETANKLDSTERKCLVMQYHEAGRCRKTLGHPLLARPLAACARPKYDGRPGTLLISQDLLTRVGAHDPSCHATQRARTKLRSDSVASWTRLVCVAWGRFHLDFSSMGAGLVWAGRLIMTPAS